MMNLYYRGYVIHEDIRSICYTIYGCRPHRIEMGSSVTAQESMRLVDRHIARRATAWWIDRDTARRRSQLPSNATQPAPL